MFAWLTDNTYSAFSQSYPAFVAGMPRNPMRDFDPGPLSSGT
jgi:hypothetical protein